MKFKNKIRILDPMAWISNSPKKFQTLDYGFEFPSWLVMIPFGLWLLAKPHRGGDWATRKTSGDWATRWIDDEGFARGLCCRWGI